jgi:hypothetical protein
MVESVPLAVEVAGSWLWRWFRVLVVLVIVVVVGTVDKTVAPNPAYVSASAMWSATVLPLQLVAAVLVSAVLVVVVAVVVIVYSTTTRAVAGCT